MTKSDSTAIFLEQIANSSRALNRAADEATNDIERIEKQLLDAEVGITVWGAEILKDDTEFEAEDGSTVTASRTVTLGFAKAGKWGIAVKEVFDKGKTRLAERTTRLRKSDRELRILAQSHLDKLVAAIAGELNARVKRIRDARNAEAVVDGASASQDKPAEKKGGAKKASAAA